MTVSTIAGTVGRLSSSWWVLLIVHPTAVAIVRFLAGRDDALATDVLDASGLQRSTLARHLRDVDIVRAHGEVGGDRATP